MTFQMDSYTSLVAYCETFDQLTLKLFLKCWLTMRLSGSMKETGLK